MHQKTLILRIWYWHECKFRRASRNRNRYNSLKPLLLPVRFYKFYPNMAVLNCFIWCPCALFVSLIRWWDYGRKRMVFWRHFPQTRPNFIAQYTLLGNTWLDIFFSYRGKHTYVKIIKWEDNTQGLFTNHVSIQIDVSNAYL